MLLKCPFTFSLQYIYIFLAALGLRCCVRAFSSCGERGLFFIAVHGLLIVMVYLVAELLKLCSRHPGFSSCSTWASVVAVHGLSSCDVRALGGAGFSSFDLVAPWHTGSSRARDVTRVSCIGRRILNHCTTREVPPFNFLLKKKFSLLILQILPAFNS